MVEGYIVTVEVFVPIEEAEYNQAFSDTKISKKEGASLAVEKKIDEYYGYEVKNVRKVK